MGQLLTTAKPRKDHRTDTLGAEREKQMRDKRKAWYSSTYGREMIVIDDPVKSFIRNELNLASEFEFVGDYLKAFGCRKTQDMHVFTAYGPVGWRVFFKWMTARIETKRRYGKVELVDLDQDHRDTMWDALMVQHMRYSQQNTKVSLEIASSANGPDVISTFLRHLRRSRRQYTKVFLDAGIDDEGKLNALSDAIIMQDSEYLDLIRKKLMGKGKMAWMDWLLVKEALFERGQTLMASRIRTRLVDN